MNNLIRKDYQVVSGKKQKYSGDLKTDHSKTGIIRKPDILEVGFRMVGFQMVGFQMVGTIPIAIVPTI